MSGYKLPDISVLSAATDRAFKQRDNLINGMIKGQIRRDKEAKELTLKAQAANDAFYTFYDKQPKSGNVLLNTASREFVVKQAQEQERLYRIAFGSGGTAEDRARYNQQVLADKQALREIGEWMVFTNNSNEQIATNASAEAKGNMVGRFTRSTNNDLDKWSFQTELQANQFSGFEFEVDPNTFNVKLTGEGSAYKGGPLNISKEMAGAKQGQPWFESIEEENKLGVVLGKRWNVGVKTKAGVVVTPLSESFSSPEKTTVKWNGTEQQWEKIVKQTFDRKAVYNELMNGDQKQVLQDTITSKNFEQMWDQLFYGGYLVNKNTGENDALGSLSWDVVSKFRTMKLEDLDTWGQNTYGDDWKTENFAGKDGKLSEAERKDFIKSMNESARNGLAIYYSQVLAPASEKVIKDIITDEKASDPNSKGQLTQKQISALSKKKAGFELNLKNAAADVNITSGVELLNKMAGIDGQMARALEANLGGGVEFRTGQEVYDVMLEAGQEIPAAIGTPPTKNNPGGVNPNAKNALFALTYAGGLESGKPASGYLANRIATSNRLDEIAAMPATDSTEKELKSRAIEDILNRGINLDPESRNYLKDQTGGINRFLQ
tara:strand:- start:8790 stop:10604 length:1815 start_codon:yes stop_codon:yes gene_type:complete